MGFIGTAGLTLLDNISWMVGGGINNVPALKTVSERGAASKSCLAFVSRFHCKDENNRIFRKY